MQQGRLAASIHKPNMKLSSAAGASSGSDAEQLLEYDLGDGLCLLAGHARFESGHGSDKMFIPWIEHVHSGMSRA